MEIITTHKNTDFDAFASVFAASILYPESMPVLPRSLNPNIHAFLSIHKDRFLYYTFKDIVPEDITRLIVVDTNEWERLENVNPLSSKPDLEVHLWDHHGDGGNISAQWSLQEPVGATTTLIVDALKKKGKELSQIEATLFLAGIYEDTGNLSFPSTRGVDARVAGHLLDLGADLGMIKNFLRPAYGPAQKEILFKMLENTERVTLNGYRVSINKQDIQGHTPGLSILMEMYLNIVNVDAAFGIFFDRKKEKCIVIGRSVGDSLDIGVIMQGMGGGGHPNAGSALLKSVNPESAETWITEMIRANQKKSVQISDLMSFPVITISPETPMKEAALLFRDKGCTGFPVVAGDKVVGMISRRDFKKVKGAAQLKSPVKAYMSSKVFLIKPDNSLTQAARIMVKHDIGRLPVIDKGKLLGIVTRSDTLRYYYNLLPE